MHRRSLVVIVAATLVGAGLGRADTKYLNAISGSWSVASDWIGGEPTGVSTTYVGHMTSGVKTGVVAVTESAEAAQTLMVGYQNGTSGGLRINGGGLTVYNLNVGHFGRGEATVRSGSFATTLFSMGYDGIGRATVTLSGGTTTVGNVSWYLGYKGKATLTVCTNGVLRNGNVLYVGNQAASCGRLNLEGGRFEGVGRTVYVAQTGIAGSTGEVVITGGVLTNFNVFQIGAASGSAGLLEIHGTNAVINLRDAAGPDQYTQQATGVLRVRLGKGGVSPIQCRNAWLAGKLQVDVASDFDGQVGDAYNLIVGVGGTWTYNGITVTNLHPHYRFSMKDSGTGDRSYTIQLDWIAPRGTLLCIR